MSGVKGRSGRKRNPTNALKYFNEQFDLNIYQLTEKVIELAKNGNKDVLMYCFDRRLGKPKQDASLEIEGGENLTAGLVAQLFEQVAKKRKELEEQKTVVEIEAGGEGDAIE